MGGHATRGMTAGSGDNICYLANLRYAETSSWEGRGAHWPLLSLLHTYLLPTLFITWEGLRTEGHDARAHLNSSPRGGRSYSYAGREHLPTARKPATRIEHLKGKEKKRRKGYAIR